MPRSSTAAYRHQARAKGRAEGRIIARWLSRHQPPEQPDLPGVIDVVESHPPEQAAHAGRNRPGQGLLDGFAQRLVLALEERTVGTPVSLPALAGLGPRA